MTKTAFNLADDYDIQEAVMMNIIKPGETVRTQLDLIPVEWAHCVPEPISTTRLYRFLRQLRQAHDALHGWLADEDNRDCLRFSLQAAFVAAVITGLYVAMAVLGR